MIGAYVTFLHMLRGQAYSSCFRSLQGSIVALLNSNVNITQSCFQQGNNQYVVFIDPDSSFESSLNYVNSYTSASCPSGNARLFKENTGSGCLVGGNTCQGICTAFASATTCLGLSVPTASPTRGPTLPPTAAPSLKPVTVSPNFPPTLPPVASPPTARPTLAPTQLSSNVPSAAHVVPQPPITSYPTEAPTIQSSFPSRRPSQPVSPRPTNKLIHFTPSPSKQAPPPPPPQPLSPKTSKIGKGVKGKGPIKGKKGPPLSIPMVLPEKGPKGAKAGCIKAPNEASVDGSIFMLPPLKGCATFPSKMSFSFYQTGGSARGPGFHKRERDLRERHQDRDTTRYREISRDTLHRYYSRDLRLRFARRTQEGGMKK